MMQFHFKQVIFFVMVLLSFAATSRSSNSERNVQVKINGLDKPVFSAEGNVIDVGLLIQEIRNGSLKAKPKDGYSRVIKPPESYYSSFEWVHSVCHFNTDAEDLRYFGLSNQLDSNSIKSFQRLDMLLCLKKTLAHVGGMNPQYIKSSDAITSRALECGYDNNHYAPIFVLGAMTNGTNATEEILPCTPEETLHSHDGRISSVFLQAARYLYYKDVLEGWANANAYYAYILEASKLYEAQNPNLFGQEQ